MSSLQRRKDNNFFHKLYVDSTSFSEHVVNWNFTSVGIALMIETDNETDVVQYSFDGKTVHGDMTPFRPSEGIVFDNRHQNRVWFRRAAPGEGVLVRVEAWRHQA